MGIAWMWGSGLAGVLALAACQTTPAFSCQDASQCGGQGQCEPSGFCSFPDPDCDSGRRYGAYAPSAIASACTGSQQGTDTTVDDDPGPGSTSADTSSTQPSPTTDGDPTNADASSSGAIDPAQTTTATTTTGVGETTHGTSDPPDPQPEVCDGIDNDLDGLVDELSEDNVMCDDCELHGLGTSVYWVCPGPATWDQAREQCLSYGADLASIHDEQEDWFLAEFVEIYETKYLWLGGNDIAKEGTWAWSDGTPWDYERWAIDQPDDANMDEDCAHHRVQAQDSEWNDLPCDQERGFICEAQDLSP